MKLVPILFSALFLLTSCFLQKNKNHARTSEFSEKNGSGAMILRFAEGSHATHPSALASEHFSNLVEEKTGGKIRIKVYYDGELGNSAEVLEQLKFGGIALGRVGYIELNDSVPALKPFSEKIISNPLVCRSEILRNKDFITEKCLAEKLYPLSVFYSDKRCFYSDSWKFFFDSMRSFKGLKIGTSPSSLIQNELKKYGADCVEISGTDTYQSMQKGFISVREGEFSDFILGDDYPFANYIMISEYISNPSVLVISNEVWNHLSIEQRKIFIDCAIESAEYQQKMTERFYTAYLKTIQKNKHTLYLQKY
ncbi:MAG: hypothetical protein IJP61_00375 [Treponema sp.]|nr:hypothetical protein [Treponema sp.]